MATSPKRIASFSTIAKKSSLVESKWIEKFNRIEQTANLLLFNYKEKIAGCIDINLHA